ncbi:MAG TPA: DUF4397 domain-containing protein [Acidobacteriaceae bacterium]|jgi:hypothetical protein|nr:DUF4397 domain-containing protein [Acidobacteriaceae bacterium]
MASTLLGLAVLCLTGCQNIQNSSPSQTMVRVIDASWNAPPVDANVGITPIAVNIGAATFTDYAFLPPENATAYIYPTKGTTATASVAGNFLVSEQHSIFLTDTSSGYQATLLTDQAANPPAGYVTLRFLQQAVRAGAVDIYLVSSTGTFAGAKPLLSDVPAGTVSGYVNVQADSYTLAIAPAGDTSVKDVYTSQPLQFTGGQVRSVLIMDAQLTTTPPVTITIGNDLN